MAQREGEVEVERVVERAGLTVALPLLPGLWVRDLRGETDFSGEAVGGEEEEGGWEVLPPPTPPPAALPVGVVEGEEGWEREGVLQGVPLGVLEVVAVEEGHWDPLRVRVGERVVVEDGEVQGVGVAQNEPRGERDGLGVELGVRREEGEGLRLCVPLGDLVAWEVPLLPPPRPPKAGVEDEDREGEGVVDGEREVERVTLPDRVLDRVPVREEDRDVEGLTLEVGDWVGLLPPLRLVLEDTLALGVAEEEGEIEPLGRALFDPGLLLRDTVFVPALEGEVLAVEEGLGVPRDEADELGLGITCCKPRAPISG